MPVFASAFPFLSSNTKHGRKKKKIKINYLRQPFIILCISHNDVKPIRVPLFNLHHKTQQRITESTLWRSACKCPVLRLSLLLRAQNISLLIGCKKAFLENCKIDQIEGRNG
ncbi:cytochrome c oxidase assembly protein COX16, partial [Striga asiatica]